MKTHNDAMLIAHKFALVKMFPNAVLHVRAIPNMYSKMTPLTAQLVHLRLFICLVWISKRYL